MCFNKVSSKNNDIKANAYPSSNTIGAIASLVALVASGVLTSYFAIGTIGFSISCSALGTSFCLLITFAIRSCCQQRTRKKVDTAARPIVTQPVVIIDQPSPAVPPSPSSSLAISASKGGYESKGADVKNKGNDQPSILTSSEGKEGNGQPSAPLINPRKEEVLPEQPSPPILTSPESNGSVQVRHSSDSTINGKQEVPPEGQLSSSHQHQNGNDLEDPSYDRKAEENPLSFQVPSPPILTSPESNGSVQVRHSSDSTINGKQEVPPEGQLSQPEQHQKQNGDNLEVPPLLRKHKIGTIHSTKEHNFKKSEVPPVPSLAKDNLLQTVTGLTGKTLQKRAYYHLLTSLIDPLLEICGLEEKKGAPPIEKINDLIFSVSRTNSLFRFLVEHNKENKLHEHLYMLFQTLLQIFDEENNLFTVRYNFFQCLNNAYATEEYKDNLSTYRSLKSLEEANSKFPEIAFLQAIGFAIFTQVFLQNYAEEAVFSVLNEGKTQYGKQEQLDPKQIKKVIESDHKTINLVSGHFKGGTGFQLYNQYKGTSNRNFNPLEENNFVSVLSQSDFQKGDKHLTPTLLRFGTPTKEKNDDPQIIPQFKLFLDYCVRHDLKVITFQLQNPKPKKVGNESKRLNEMFLLSKDSYYEKNFFVFGFTKDSDFFKQIGTFQGKEWNEFELFKNEFVARLFGMSADASSIKLPLENVKSFFKNVKQEEEIRDLIKAVHRLFFKSASTLDPAKRRVFQVITYALLVDYNVIGVEADFFFIQCKDAQDRAMVLAVVHRYLSLIRMGKENDPEELKNLRVQVEFACLLIKAMSMHHHRFPLLLEVMDHLASLSDDEKKVIRETPLKVNGIDCMLVDSRIEKIPTQTLARLPSEALNFDEYKNLLKTALNNTEILEYKIPNFTRQFFEPNKSEGISNGVNQFKKDLNRQLYLIDNKKIEIPEFREQLRLIVNAEKEILKEEETVEKVVNEIVDFEKNASVVFKKLLSKKWGKVPGFVDKVIALSQTLREAEIKKFAQKWSQEVNISCDEILALSQQGVVADISYILERSFKLATYGLNPPLEVYERTDAESTKNQHELSAFQRESKETYNTCINYRTEKNRHILEVFQIYEICEKKIGEVKSYISTRIEIDLNTGHAKIYIDPPLPKDPGDISLIVKKKNRTADELANSFME